MSFHRGAIAPPEKKASGPFEFALISDLEKRELCVGLLAEFGVVHYKENAEGELIHSCSIPGSGHRNGDKNASASLNWKKLTFNCLGCGSSGGVIWYIAMCRGLDGPGAREWLGAQTGLGQRSMDLPKLLDLITMIFGQHSEYSPIPNYDPRVLDPWLDWEDHHPYLTDGGGILDKHRDIPVETIEHFRLGYADEYFDGSERIIIPIFWKEKLVGWQARCLPGYTGNDKYRNSPELPRDRILYNHARRRELILVESPMSVLRHYHQIPQMEASFGAKVTDAQLRLCQRYQRVVLWFDNDKAGWQATQRVGAELARYVPVSVVNSAYNADPADMDDDTVADLVDNHRIPFTLWEPPEELIEWSN